MLTNATQTPGMTADPNSPPAPDLVSPEVPLTTRRPNIQNRRTRRYTLGDDREEGVDPPPLTTSAQAGADRGRRLEVKELNRTRATGPRGSTSRR